MKTIRTTRPGPSLLHALLVVGSGAAGCDVLPLPRIGDGVDIAYLALFDDSDADGVPDDDDRCAATGDGAAVDAQGCAADQLDVARRIRIEPVTGAVELPYTISMRGAGTGTIGAFDVVDGFGEVWIDGKPLSTLLYERIPWPAYDYVLYQGLAVSTDRWYALWFYCRGPQVEWVYFTGTDGTPMEFEAASGTSRFSASPVSCNVAFPAVDMPYPQPALGYVLDGDRVSLDGGPEGRVTLGGREMTLLPFEHVDCLTCGGSGWYEMHALLWDPDVGQACFSIFYMFPGTGPATESDTILMEYSVSVGSGVEVERPGMAPLHRIRRIGLAAAWAVP